MGNWTHVFLDRVRLDLPALVPNARNGIACGLIFEPQKPKAIDVKFFAVLIFALILNLASSASFSGETFKIGILNVAPFGSIQDRRAIGLYVDFARAISKEAGIDFDIQIRPFPRIIYEAEHGELDATIIGTNETLDEAFEPFGPLFVHDIVAIPSKSITLKTFDDLHALSVTNLRGLVYDPRLTDAIKTKGVQVIEAGTYLQMFDLVASGRAAAMVAPYWALKFAALEGHRDLNQFGAPLLLNHRPMFFYLRRSFEDADMKARLARAVERLIAKQEFAKIASFYR
jgi:ABC-type amino acid transport substrate-binding protein